MAKLTLNPNPTFKAKVDIPTHGGGSAEVDFTFKHRKKDELQEWLRVERDDVATILEMVAGWDLEEPFNAESVGVLVQNYIGAASAIFDKYVAELLRTRAKN